jgi:hypothetical protein
MEYNLVWREERVTAFTLAGCSRAVSVVPPIVLWRKSVPVRTDHFLLDAKRSPSVLRLSELGVAYARSLPAGPLPLKYGIVVRGCVRVPASYEVFASLCAEGWLSLWHPSAPLAYFSGRPVATLILVQAIELPVEADVHLLDRGRAGGNFYSALAKTFTTPEGHFVVPPGRFEERRERLLDFLSSRGWILSESQSAPDSEDAETLF